ncbi:polysaccharide biosynthesis C-terminal domain-containing protein [Clostridium perfringens]|uniref:oligosaccharide flippase family protein n=1 Tax=Clostridium perfringens TaxID=1502 RepID=UPI001B1A29EE|nr:polysaccharide biosynthesis C-terminal domain-containing protein [Clostridium perfringens]MBO3382405.1 polysaccharide biosynthesis C-terminal domain-containing protein [Clostridium perfringens]
MSSVKKNYIYNLLYQVLLIITPLFTAPYISRRLGPQMIGIQSFYYSVVTYFVLFCMLGVLNFGNRSIAKVRNNRQELTKTFWTIYGFQFIRSIIITFIYFAYVLIFAREYFVIAIINGLYVIAALLDISWMFFGLEQFKITVTRNIIIKLLNVVCIFLFIKGPEDLWIYSLITVLSTLLSNGYLWFYLKRYVGWYRPKFSEIKNNIKPELILFIPAIAVSLYKVMDRIMLGIFSNEAQLGFFTSSESVINIPMSLITALGTVMLPRITNMIANGENEKIKEYIENSIFFVVMMSIAMTFGLAAIAPTFAPVFFGEEFSECSPIIIGLSITIIFISWANVIRTQYLIPRGKDKSYLISIVFGAIINLIINFLLIPKFEAIGAVVGTVCAEATVCIIQTMMVRKNLPIRKYILDNLIFILFGIIMFIGVRSVGSFFANKILRLLIEIVVGIIIYCGLISIYLIRIKQINIFYNFKIKEKL